MSFIYIYLCIHTNYIANFFLLQTCLFITAIIINFIVLVEIIIETVYIFINIKIVIEYCLTTVHPFLYCFLTD